MEKKIYLAMMYGNCQAHLITLNFFPVLRDTDVDHVLTDYTCQTLGKVRGK